MRRFDVWLVIPETLQSFDLLGFNATDEKLMTFSLGGVMELEPKAQNIFDRIKPFSPETAYEKGLISAEERLFLTERKWAQNNKASLW